MIAWLEQADAAADLLDDARSLVPAHDRVADRDVAGAQVVIGVARPAAVNRISTSPSLGGSRSSSMISQSLPMSLSTAALVLV